MLGCCHFLCSVFQVTCTNYKDVLLTLIHLAATMFASYLNIEMKHRLICNKLHKGRGVKGHM